MTVIFKISHLGALVLEALKMPLNKKSVIDGLPSAFTPLTPSTLHDVPTPSTLHDVPTPSSLHDVPTPSTLHDVPMPSTLNDGIPVQEHALNMLVNVLRNVDEWNKFSLTINFPMEVRVNTCTFFLQLQKHVSSESLAPVRETVLPVLQQIIEDSEVQDEKLIKVANLLITSWATTRPSITYFNNLVARKLE